MALIRSKFDGFIPIAGCSSFAPPIGDVFYRHLGTQPKRLAATSPELAVRMNMVYLGFYNMDGKLKHPIGDL